MLTPGGFFFKGIMSGEIKNRVSENTNLLTFNLEDYYVEGRRVQIDISQWLDQGFILREKDFRASLENHKWAQYKGMYARCIVVQMQLSLGGLLYCSPLN